MMKRVKTIIGRGLGIAISMLCKISCIPVALVALLSTILLNVLIFVFTRAAAFAVALTEGKMTLKMPGYFVLAKKYKRRRNYARHRRVELSWRRDLPYEHDKYD